MRYTRAAVSVRIDMTVFLLPMLWRSSIRATGAVSDQWPGLKPS